MILHSKIHDSPNSNSGGENTQNKEKNTDIMNEKNKPVRVVTRKKKLRFMTLSKNI